MAEDTYVFDPAEEKFVPNPEITQKDSFGRLDIVDGELVVLNYETLTGNYVQNPGGDSPGEIYPPGTVSLVSQTPHIAMDGTIRVDIVLEVVDEEPGQQYELRVTRG